MNIVKVKDDLYVPEDFGKHHHYFADAEGEKEYTGITSAIGVLAKPALIGWAAKCVVEYIKEHAEFGSDYGGELNRKTLYPEGWFVTEELLEEARTAHARKKDKAAEHGTDAHALVEGYIKECISFGEVRPVNKIGGLYEPIWPFINWAIASVDHFLFAERRMANKELFLAGTADFACVMKDGKKLMGDFKTSSGIYGIDYWLQVAAYRLLAEGEGDAPYDGAVIVRLGKKGPEDFEVKYLYEYETFRDAFLSCLKIYRAQAAIKGMTVH